MRRQKNLYVELFDGDMWNVPVYEGGISKKQSNESGLPL